jgi:Tfp pilus assembly protein PilO
MADVVAVPVVGLMVVLVVHAGALFYWGGRLTERVRVHEQEIHALRQAKHAHANLLTELVARVQELEERHA